jgi:hypothetical protein
MCSLAEFQEDHLIDQPRTRSLRGLLPPATHDQDENIIPKANFVRPRSLTNTWKVQKGVT